MYILYTYHMYVHICYIFVTTLEQKVRRYNLYQM